VTRNVSGAKAHVQEYEALINGLRAEVAGLRVQLNKRVSHKKKGRSQRRLNAGAGDGGEEEDEDDEESSDDEEDDDDAELAGENDLIGDPTTPGTPRIEIAAI
jgi:TATA-binding protein-associated factor Taf7